jgi:hypothetical protein
MIIYRFAGKAHPHKIDEARQKFAAGHGEPHANHRIRLNEGARHPRNATGRLSRSPVLATEGETLSLPSTVVVEIKRPMRNDASADKDPIQQTLDYVKRVRTGGVMTAAGASDSGLA